MSCVCVNVLDVFVVFGTGSLAATMRGFTACVLCLFLCVLCFAFAIGNFKLACCVLCLYFIVSVVLCVLCFVFVVYVCCVFCVCCLLFMFLCVFVIAPLKGKLFLNVMCAALYLCNALEEILCSLRLEDQTERDQTDVTASQLERLQCRALASLQFWSLQLEREVTHGETPRSRISGEEGRCSGGGGGEGGSAQQFCSSRTAPASTQCHSTTNAGKGLLNALPINNKLWYDPTVIKSGRQKKEDQCCFRRCIKRHKG